MNIFLKFFKLPFGQKVLLLRVLASISIITILLKITPFNIFKKIYKLYSSFQFLKIKNKDWLFYFIKAVGNTFPLAFSCLPQALTAKSFLNNDSNYILKIGINSNKVTFEAHAWLTFKDDIVLGDLPSETFVPLWDWQ